MFPPSRFASYPCVYDHANCKTFVFVLYAYSVVSPQEYHNRGTLAGTLVWRAPQWGTWTVYRQWLWSTTLSACGMRPCWHRSGSPSTPPRWGNCACFCSTTYQRKSVRMNVHDVQKQLSYVGRNFRSPCNVAMLCVYLWTQCLGLLRMCLLPEK